MTFDNPKIMKYLNDVENTENQCSINREDFKCKRI